jgi:hypothetical protein
MFAEPLQRAVRTKVSDKRALVEMILRDLKAVRGDMAAL